MSIQRHIPIHMEPVRWYADEFATDPFFRNYNSGYHSSHVTHSSPFRDVVREQISRDPAFYQPPPPAVLPLSRSFFNPERQLASMDSEMQRMGSEMRRMFTDMQHLMPVDANPESWRVKENYHLDNPVHHDHRTGNRLFRLQFDVRQFKPDEIYVKTQGNQLEVHAKHVEQSEGKSVNREYHRQYQLPKDLSPDHLQSKLSRDGVLTIEAPLPIADGPKDKLIPIKHE